jgi:hypothetical protein
MVALEKLAREYLDTKPEWAAVWGEELSRLRAAEREAMRKQVNRVFDEIASPKHQQHLAQLKRDRQRYPD